MPCRPGLLGRLTGGSQARLRRLNERVLLDRHGWHFRHPQGSPGLRIRNSKKPDFSHGLFRCLERPRSTARMRFSAPTGTSPLSCCPVLHSLVELQFELPNTFSADADQFASLLEAASRLTVQTFTPNESPNVIIRKAGARYENIGLSTFGDASQCVFGCILQKRNICSLAWEQLGTRFGFLHWFARDAGLKH